MLFSLSFCIADILNPSFDLRRETALVAAELMLMPMLYYVLCIATRDGEYSSGAAFNF